VHAARLRAGLAFAGIAAAAVGVFASAACAHRRQAPPPDSPAEVRTVPPGPDREATLPNARDVQVGYATWYGRAFAGHRTASGERFDPGKMTAAHRTLPFGTWVEVTRVDNGKSVRVRVTDRGPWGHEDRVIDLSQAAAAKIGLTKVGMTRVEVRVVPAPVD
jgi:peptidoglycan lytic transglycosylase